MSKRTERDEQLCVLIEKGKQKFEPVPFLYTLQDLDDMEAGIEDIIVEWFSEFRLMSSFTFSLSPSSVLLTKQFKNTTYHKWLKNHRELRDFVEKQVKSFINVIVNKWNNTHTAFILSTMEEFQFSIRVNKNE